VFRLTLPVWSAEATETLPARPVATEESTFFATPLAALLADPSTAAIDEVFGDESAFTMPASGTNHMLVVAVGDTQAARLIDHEGGDHVASGVGLLARSLDPAHGILRRGDDHARRGMPDSLGDVLELGKGQEHIEGQASHDRK
jgi:hypothetical protein